jgi:hypothetical protein
MERRRQWITSPSATAPNTNCKSVGTGPKSGSAVNTLTPNDLYRSRAVSPLKIKIPSKNMREKPTNTPIIDSVYYVW